MISGADLSRNPKYNKGLAFTEIERDRLYLRGLLPPAILSQDVQVGYHDAGLPYQHDHIKQQLDKHWLLAFKALLYLSFAAGLTQRKGFSVRCVHLTTDQEHILLLHAIQFAIA